MKERPILFSAPMVRALLDGSKTQTRRAFSARMIKLMSVAASIGEVSRFLEESALRGHDLPYIQQFSPCGQPGDRLWVREAWRTVEDADSLAPRDLTPAHRIWHETGAPHQPGFGKLRPSMFMPRWASRIDLEITAVRVERLRDISEADAVAEGCCSRTYRDGRGHEPATLDYERLWDRINGAGSWAANPWVWVVEFKRVAV